jgi:hypothetical protein
VDAHLAVTDAALRLLTIGHGTDSPNVALRHPSRPMPTTWPRIHSAGPRRARSAKRQERSWSSCARSHSGGAAAGASSRTPPRCSPAPMSCTWLTMGDRGCTGLPEACDATRVAALCTTLAPTLKIRQLEWARRRLAHQRYGRAGATPRVKGGHRRRGRRAGGGSTQGPRRATMPVPARPRRRSPLRR